MHVSKYTERCSTEAQCLCRVLPIINTMAKKRITSIYTGFYIYNESIYKCIQEKENTSTNQSTIRVFVPGENQFRATLKSCFTPSGEWSVKVSCKSRDLFLKFIIFLKVKGAGRHLISIFNIFKIPALQLSVELHSNTAYSKNYHQGRFYICFLLLCF